MAVKTDLTQDEFRVILTSYRLGTFIRAEPVAAGSVQTSYFLRTSTGRFFFRLYENRPRESVGFECGLMDYLQRRSYPCPAPLRNVHGRFVGSIRGKPFALFTFIEGEHLEHPTPEQERQLIRRVAELQNLTSSYRPHSRRFRWNYTPAFCKNLAAETAQKIGTSNALSKLDWYLGVLDGLDLPRALPKGICHCDFHFSNILFRDGQFAALIDFDDANYTYRAFDLVTLLDPFIPAFDWTTWTDFRPGAPVIDLAHARTVVAEYEKARRLSPLERKHLFDLVKFSVLIDCLWYFERGDVDDFFEKRKIDALDTLGREAFTKSIWA